LTLSKEKEDFANGKLQRAWRANKSNARSFNALVNGL
jgi:hypothetical protein